MFLILGCIFDLEYSDVYILVKFSKKGEIKKILHKLKSIIFSKLILIESIASHIADVTLLIFIIWLEIQS